MVLLTSTKCSYYSSFCERKTVCSGLGKITRWSFGHTYLIAFSIVVLRIRKFMEALRYPRNMTYLIGLVWFRRRDNVRGLGCTVVPELGDCRATTMLLASFQLSTQLNFNGKLRSDHRLPASEVQERLSYL